MLRKKKLFKAIAEIKIRLAIGQSWFYDLRNAVLISASLKVLFEMSITQSILSTIVLIFCFYITGFLDLKYFKIHQKIQELNTSKYNPHLNKIKKIK